MNQPVSIAYPAFFDDADQKTASIASHLYRRVYPYLRGGIQAIAGPGTVGSMRGVRDIIQHTGNGLIGSVGGQMLDRATGGDGGVGATVGGVASMLPMFMGRRARRLPFGMTSKVLSLGALDTLQRARMGYSSLDPNSVKQHMQTQMANEIQPILEPWQKLLSEQQAKPPMTTNSQLIRQMQGAQQKIPGFFG